MTCIYIVTSCTSQYEFEDKMYECTKETYRSADINLDQIIFDFETYLTEKKYLKNTSPQSYSQLIDSLTQPSLFQITLPKELSSKMVSVNLMNNCVDNITDSTELKQSRLFEIAFEMKKVFEQISKLGELDPGKINKDLLTIFRKDDFQHPLYKLTFFNLLNMYVFDLQQNRGVLGTLPAWSEDEPDITKFQERNIYSVLVNSKNEIFVRNKPIELKDLRMSTKEFISNPNHKSDLAESPTKAIISLKNERNTKYKTYIDVLNELKAAYNELRNEKAIELYNLSYEKLEKTQQKEIRNMYPLIISEAEPTAFREEG